MKLEIVEPPVQKDYVLTLDEIEFRALHLLLGEVVGDCPLDRARSAICGVAGMAYKESADVAEGDYSVKLGSLQWVAEDGH